MIHAIMIGAGARGIGAYGGYALKHPDQIRFVAVAEPDPMRRAYFAMQHQIPPERQFETDKEILALPKMADACFLCTQDAQHFESAMQAIAQGYHLFLEKPMAIAPRDVTMIARQAKAFGVRVMIGHVLRYTGFFRTIRDRLEKGAIGELVTIQHNENVSYWHQAHSYVRGNWRNLTVASPMILAKSCHDLDLLIWLARSAPKFVSSFGSLTHFHAQHAPVGAPLFCMDGCPHQDQCPYFAPKVYTNAPDWMRLAVANDLSDASMLAHLKHGPYGRCVYHCDNDVVDHQVLVVEFENKATAAFTMTAFTHENTRTIKLMGTKGEIRGHMDKQEIEIHVFGSDKVETIATDEGASGHGGGDDGIMTAFIDELKRPGSPDYANMEGAVHAHLAAFAAETSRLEKRVVDMKNFTEDWSV
jgi:predicted dehydrogenase